MSLNIQQTLSKESYVELVTPALVVDLDLMTKNIEMMAVHAVRYGVNLRPHVKAHKCVEIAKMQKFSGAIGLSCATLAEAESMVSHCHGSILITSPIVSEVKIRRLGEMLRTYPQVEIMVVCDNAENLSDIVSLCGPTPQPIGVLIDLDVGQNRTGVRDIEGLVLLARHILDEPKTKLCGLQGYAGHIQHIRNDSERQQAAGSVHRLISETVQMAQSQDIYFDIITGGGTGTHEYDAMSGVFTELQPGSYVFMDDEYSNVLSSEGKKPSFAVALYVEATVVSTNQRELVVVDAGTKSFATDSGVPVINPVCGFSGEYTFAGDEHGKVSVKELRPTLGQLIQFVTPHCDPTVNLYDVLHVRDGEKIVDIWPIHARGKW